MNHKILCCFGLVVLLVACRSTHKIIVENDFAEGAIKKRSDHTTHVVIGFININKDSRETQKCGTDKWARVSSEQEPLWSALRVTAAVGSTAASIAQVAAPMGLLTVYSQVETKWFCR